MANEIYQQILTNQNAEHRANQAQRESINTQLTQALSSLDTLANRVYGYTHSAVVTDDLEKDYQDIITANPDLANVSAVGLLAILSDGDTVTAQGNRLFINGTEEQADYSFSGENSENGIEFVKVWYFENEAPITLQGDCPFNTSVLLYKVKTNNPNLSDSYMAAQTVISDGNYNVTGNCIKNVIFKNNSGSNSVANMMNFYSEQEVLNVSGLFGGTSLKTVSFPYLNTIQHPIYNSIMFNNISAKLEFPNLKNIIGGNSALHIVFGASGNNSPFNLIIPESVENIEKIICVGNFALLRLDCKDAKSISNNWCDTAQSNFQMCNDWGASINIKISAANWSMQNFINLMTNQLRDMTLTEETRTLTIPSAMLTSLQADTDGLAAIEAATDKGWTIGGA